MDDLTPITPEHLGPFAQLLGVHVVPELATVPDHLVVCGRRVTCLTEIVTVLGLKSAGAEPDPLGEEKGLWALAHRYAARIDSRAKAEKDDTPWPLRVGQDGLTNRQRAAREYYAKNREQIRAYDQARRDAKKAARQAATPPAPEAPAEVLKARPKTLEQILAAIDADGTLTLKQKQNRRYIARHRDELLQKKREYYCAHLDEEQARRREVHHQRRARGNQEQQPCA
jgi:hypothetical protein